VSFINSIFNEMDNVDNNVSPALDNTFNLGSSTRRWGALSCVNVNITTLDATNIEVTNVKAKDGSECFSIADSTGIATLAAAININKKNVGSITNASTDDATETLNLYGGSTADGNGANIALRGKTSAVSNGVIDIYTPDAAGAANIQRARVGAMQDQGSAPIILYERIDFAAPSGTQSTVGAAGGASALPATPSGYIKVKVGGSDFVIPYYAAS
jgi:hypothetical protein